jgi:uncharacterized protein (DUF305 family)
MRTVGRKAAITASAIAIAGLGMGVLGACSSGSSSDSTSQVTGNPNANNQQDSVFANQTISLNEQLITLTDVLSAKTDDDPTATELEGLGRTANERIVLASGWLTSWGRSNSEAPDPPGMLTGRQVTAITVANGEKLKTLVTNAVEEHLAGVIAVSDAELADGVNPAAREFAEKLKADAEAELAPLLAINS